MVEFAAYSLVMQVDEAVTTRYARVRFNLKKTELLFLKTTYGLQQHVWSSKFHFSAEMLILSMLKG